MKSKHLLLMLLMAFFAPWAAQAQEELTVYDGTNTNSNVPFYGLYADTQGAASECVIPSDELEAMTGGQITEMKFYITTAASVAWTGTHQVYLGEVDATTLTGITGPSAFTVVKTASFDATGTELTIEFDEPYTYGGGNLLIGTYVSVAGNWKSASFAGVSQTENTAWYRNNESASGSAVKFLPKTTFTYIPSGGSYCAKPTNVAMSLDGTTATVTWEGEAVDYNIDVDGTVTNNVTSPYTFEVELSTTYTVMVQANCEDELQSGWTNPVSLTTPDCLGGHIVEYTLTDSYGDGWNGNAIQVMEGCNVIETLTIENGNTASGTLTLCGDYYEFIWVKGSYPSETSWSFTVDGNAAFSGTGNTNMATGDVLYTLGAESCARPDNLAVSNVTNHSATLSWTGAEGQNDWEIKYNAGADFDPEAEGTLVEDEYIASPHTFNKTLEANTHYYIYMRANCGDENYSCWVGTDFTTGIAAPAPSNLHVNSTTPNSFWLAWDAAGGDFLASYDVYITQSVLDEPNAETEATLTTNGVVEFMNIEGVEENEVYYCYVRANHIRNEETLHSTWTSMLQVNTPEACPKPYLLTASNPTPTSITLNWTEGAEWQYEWQVAYSTEEGFDPDEIDPETYVLVWGNNPLPYEVTGLQSNTTYYFRVRGHCTGDYGYSDWNETEVSETTLVACPVPTNLVANVAQNSATLSWTGYSDSYAVQYREAAYDDIFFEEGFEEENYLDNWTFTSMNTANDIESGKAGRMTGVAHSGEYGFRFSSYSSASDYNQYLVSSELTVTGNLKFYAKKYNTSTENFYVGYSTTTDDLDAFTWSEDLGLTTSWVEYTQELPTDVKYVAFHYYGNFTYYVYLDDITISTEVPASEWVDAGTTTTNSMTLNLEYGTKYDAQVKANCGDEYCDYVTFTTNALKRFTTEGDWSVADNWTPAGVPTIEDNVSIEADALITDIATANEITINGGSITIEEGGQLYHNNAVAVTLIKGIEGWTPTSDPNQNKDGYALIASPVYQYGSSPYLYRPVEGTGLNTGNYDLYEFNQNYQGAEWRNYKNNEFESLYVGEGYLYANEEGINDITFEGTALPTTEITRSLVYNSGFDFTGWNLMGNPFTCVAYVNRGFYTLNGEGNEVVSATSNSIEVMEGIFVVAEGQNETVTFSTTAPGKSANLVLNLNNGRNLVDRAIVSFGESSQLRKFQLNPNHTKVYIPKDGVDYAIVNASEMGEMPVNFKAENNGNFTMNFTSENVSFNYLHLIDNMTGADVDLLATPSYSFSAQTTDYAHRFKLVFATGNNSNEDNFAFFSNGSFVINNDGEATLQVVDVMGRIIKSETINGSASVNVNAAPGVYMLRLVNGDNMKVQKVVVR